MCAWEIFFSSSIVPLVFFSFSFPSVKHYLPFSFSFFYLCLHIFWPRYITFFIVAMSWGAPRLLFMIIFQHGIMNLFTTCSTFSLFFSIDFLSQSFVFFSFSFFFFSFVTLNTISRCQYIFRPLLGFTLRWIYSLTHTFVPINFVEGNNRRYIFYTVKLYPREMQTRSYLLFWLFFSFLFVKHNFHNFKYSAFNLNLKRLPYIFPLSTSFSLSLFWASLILGSRIYGNQTHCFNIQRVNCSKHITKKNYLNLIIIPHYRTALCDERQRIHQIFNQFSRFTSLRLFSVVFNRLYEFLINSSALLLITLVSNSKFNLQGKQKRYSLWHSTLVSADRRGDFPLMIPRWRGFGALHTSESRLW